MRQGPPTPRKGGCNRAEGPNAPPAARSSAPPASEPRDSFRPARQSRASAERWFFVEVHESAGGNAIEHTNVGSLKLVAVI